MSIPRRIGIVGGRGYTGVEVIRLVGAHPELELALAVSRSQAGAQVEAGPEGLVYEELSPSQLAARGLDGLVLALANGEAASYARALPASISVVDLSADHRFEPAWVYGLTERERERVRNTPRVANPGCYATATQLALWPLLPWLHGPSHAFGVSGYSGAGSKPSERNDLERLRDNIVPYALVDHLHEREVSHRLGHPVRLLPHVAPFARGLSVTLSFELREPTDRAELLDALLTRYHKEPLILVQEEIPTAREAVGAHYVRLGGLTVSPDGRHGALVATLDNLLKGAATQAIQNLCLQLGVDEFAALQLPSPPDF